MRLNFRLLMGGMVVFLGINVSVVQAATNAEALQEAALRYGEALVATTFAQDALRQGRRTLGYRGEAATEFNTLQSQEAAQWARLQAWRGRYLALYRLVLGVSANGHPPPLTAEEEALRRDEAAVARQVTALRKDVEETFRAASDLRAAAQSALAKRVLQGSAPPEAAKPSSLLRGDGRHDGFLFGLPVGPSSGYAFTLPYIQVLDYDFEGQLYVSVRSPQPGTYDFDDTFVPPPSPYAHPIELITPNAIGNWQAVPE